VLDAARVCEGETGRDPVGEGATQTRQVALPQVGEARPDDGHVPLRVVERTVDLGALGLRPARGRDERAARRVEHGRGVGPLRAAQERDRVDRRLAQLVGTPQHLEVARPTALDACQQVGSHPRPVHRRAGEHATPERDHGQLIGRQADGPQGRLERDPVAVHGQHVRVGPAARGRRWHLVRLGLAIPLAGGRVLPVTVGVLDIGVGAGADRCGLAVPRQARARSHPVGRCAVGCADAREGLVGPALGRRGDGASHQDQHTDVGR